MTASSRPWKELKQIRSCSVFALPEAIYVSSAARTIPGFTIDSEPVFRLERNSSPNALGAALIDALNSFRLDVEAPDPRHKRVSALLKRTGKRSWKQLEKEALHIVVSLDRTTVSVIPTAHDANHGGYLHRPDLASECKLEAHELGTTALRVLEHCS